MQQQNAVVVPAHRLVWVEAEAGAITALGINRPIIAIKIAKVVMRIRSALDPAPGPLIGRLRDVVLIRQLASNHPPQQLEGGITFHLGKRLLVTLESTGRVVLAPMHNSLCHVPKNRAAPMRCAAATAAANRQNRLTLASQEAIAEQRRDHRAILHRMRLNPLLGLKVPSR